MFFIQDNIKKKKMQFENIVKKVYTYLNMQMQC